MNKISKNQFPQNSSFIKKSDKNAPIKSNNVPSTNSGEGMNALSTYNKTLVNHAIKANSVSFKGTESNEDLDWDNILNWLLQVEEEMEADLENPEEIDTGYKTSSEWPQRYEMLNKLYSPVDVDDKDIKNLMRSFFTNEDKSTENTIKTADFSRYGKDGIPLSYTRQEFLTDLSSQLSTYSPAKQLEIYDKIGIQPHHDFYTGELTGFDGFLTYNNLDRNNRDEEEIYTIVHKFLKENSINTDDKELNKTLNALIQGLPEFISIIGKKQHELQDYSVDVHILKVLQKAMSNPNYEKLSNIEKTALKWTITLHDIAKQENENDYTHPQTSADISRNILSRYKFPATLKQRIYELIKNHHWLTAYNMGDASAEDIAVIFRRKGDIDIARIISEADLKSINESGSFWNDFGCVLDSKRQKPIDDAIKLQRETGQLLYSSKIVNSGNIPEINYKGNSYKVIDINGLTNEELASIYTPDTTKENLRFALHVVNDEDENAIQKLETAYSLGDTASDGVLSVSFISLEDKKTLCDYKFGLSFDVSPENTVNAHYSNQYSGTLKNEEDLIELTKADNEFLSNFRKLIPDAIKKELNLNDDEYRQLYDMICDNQSLSRIYINNQKTKTGKEISINKKFVINGKTINGKDVVNAIRKAGNNLIKETFNFNEINLYKPIANAFIAKVDSIEEIPESMLNFVQKHSLPIVLIGKDAPKSDYDAVLQSLIN